MGTQGVAVVTAVGKVCDDHHIVARPAVFPTMKGDHLVGVVDVMDVDLLATKTARLVEPVAAQANQVAIESIDARVGIKFRPVQGEPSRGSICLQEIPGLERSLGCRAR